MIITNAFSLNMLSTLNANITVRPISPGDVRDITTDQGFQSAIGHPDTAAIVSQQLSLDIPAQRQTITLEPGHRIIVAQYRGPRLEAGATELPDGATIEYAIVAISEGRIAPKPARKFYVGDRVRIDSQHTSLHGQAGEVIEVDTDRYTPHRVKLHTPYRVQLDDAPYPAWWTPQELKPEQE